MEKAFLVNTGEEVVRGEITNLDASLLARALIAAGFDVAGQMSCGDGMDDLIWAVKTAMARAPWVFITGGLGPTCDDNTTEAVCSALQKPLFFDEASWNLIKERFSRLGLEAGESNRKQAFFPEGAKVLPNPHGSAPGFWLQWQDRHLVVLPGPPGEMLPMAEAFLAPFKREEKPVFFARILGLGESMLTERLEPWMKTHGFLGFRAVFPEVVVKCYDFTLSSSLAQFLSQNLSAHLLDFSDASTPELFLRFLDEENLSFALAESCTGGLCAKLLTDLPGVSKHFLGGAVTYSLEAKERILGVDSQTLLQKGAVSAKTAQEMARGAAKAFGAQASLAITGIAGPSGGSESMPVGTVWMGKTLWGESRERLFSFPPQREVVRHFAACHGLRWVMEPWLAKRWQQAITHWESS